MQEKWEVATVGGDPMRNFLAIPEGSGPFPGVIVIMHAVGLDDFTIGMARRLVEAGYGVIAPDLYHREPPETENQPFERMGRLEDDKVDNDVRAAYQILIDQPEIDSGRIGITGFCMGGRVTYLMASTNLEFKAAVSFYGGAIRKAWGVGQSPLDRTSNISCPITLFFGDLDPDPSPEHREEIEEYLKKHDKIYETHRYADAGHAFMGWDRPEMYNGAAAEDAWSKTLKFFGKHLLG